MSDVIPLVLFVYDRPEHTRRVLQCFRDANIPKLIVYADGPKAGANAVATEATRDLIKNIDWTDVTAIYRPENLGLGKSILAGVEAVAAEYSSFIVWEDDLICVPGTYDWLCAALRAYENNVSVGSVTAWSHPRIRPANCGDVYFDGRAECWGWGSWSNRWQGMGDEIALQKMRTLKSIGISPSLYGSDLPQMAKDECRKNIWAVRWLYHHLQHRRLCVRPCKSMVEHIGIDSGATNAIGDNTWSNLPLSDAPFIPIIWPNPIEEPSIQKLWQKAARRRSLFRRILHRLKNLSAVR